MEGKIRDSWMTPSAERDTKGGLLLLLLIRRWQRRTRSQKKMKGEGEETQHKSRGEGFKRPFVVYVGHYHYARRITAEAQFAV